MYSAIPTVDISGPRAALQRQRRKYGSLTGQVGVIELSKIPRDIWARVALSDLILHIYFGQGDVEQQPSNSRSYLRYWAYRIYIYTYIGEWSNVMDIHLYFLGRGQEITCETLFFSHFFSRRQHCLKISESCSQINQLSIFEHTFYSNTYLAFPKFIR